MLPKQQMPKAHRSESENKPPKRKWKQAIKKKWKQRDSNIMKHPNLKSILDVKLWKIA